MSTFLTLIQHSARIHSQNNKPGARNKGSQIEKEEVKLSIFADDMIVYIKDPENATKRTLRFHKHIQQSSKIMKSIHKNQ
jgi:hypothetical protein